MQYKVFTATYRKADGALDGVEPLVEQVLGEWCSTYYNPQIGRESLITHEHNRDKLVPTAEVLVKDIKSLLGDYAPETRAIYKGIRSFVEQFLSSSFKDLFTPISKMDHPESWEVFNSVTNEEHRMAILRLKDFPDQFRTKTTDDWKQYDIDNCRFALAANKVLNMLRGTKALELDLWAISKVYELRLLLNKSCEDLDTWMKYQPFENEELENKYIDHVQGNENLELASNPLLDFDIDYNSAFTIIGKYFMADSLFSLADQHGRQEKLVTAHKAQAIKNAQIWSKDEYKTVQPFTCETYMLPSQQIKVYLEWCKQMGGSSWTEVIFGQPPVYSMNLPDLV